MMSNFLIHKLTADISNSDEDFLKEFLRDFYQKIIEEKDFNTFEDALTEWIKNIDKKDKSIFESMKNHHQTKFLFSSIIGFFYQLGICCDVDKNKALELYLLAINNDDCEFLNQNFAHLHLLEANDNEFDKLQSINSINIIVGKYLLSLFYYKDVILDKKLSGSVAINVKVHSANLITKPNSNKTNEGTTKSDINQENSAVKDNLKDCSNQGKKEIEASEDQKKFKIGDKDNLKGSNQDKKEIKPEDQNIFKKYLESAKKGDSIAQCYVGHCYWHGQEIT